MSVVFKTTARPKLENQNKFNKSLSQIITKNKIIEKNVMSEPKYHTNLRGKREKLVILLIASSKSLP